ncbi:MAG: cyclic nucleotide-binding domain-containing protein [Lachnospiraceae bacterium]|nr:cyclic nucleotide-binding domain-containing protein [Lachnospiraceae bacterium]
MESRQELMKIISKLEQKRFVYLERFFQNCPEHVIRSIQRLHVPKQHHLLRAGEPCTQVVIVLNGTAIGIDYQSSGTDYVFTDYSGVEILGDYELFGDIPQYRISILAVTACDLLTIPSRAYMEWISKDVNALFMRTRSIMYATVREGPKERKYQFLECGERMVLYLAENYEKSGVRDEYVLLKKQSDLAAQLGFSVRTIQRNIQTLEKAGLITAVAGRIHITREQYERLRKRAEEISGVNE